MPELRMVRALNQALGESLERDPRVILLGEDIGNAGGAFNVTRGLHARFPNRVLDTPISEATITAASGSKSAAVTLVKSRYSFRPAK